MERTLSKNWKQWLRWESRLGQGFVCFKMVETWASLFFYYYFWLHHIAWRILVLLKVVQLCPTLCNLMGYAVHGILQARILEWVAVCFSRDLSNPGIEPRSPALQADSLPAEPPGKPKNTGVGSLCLLQWIFPPRNQCLLHCRWILYQQGLNLSPQWKHGLPGKSWSSLNDNGTFQQ